MRSYFEWRKRNKEKYADLRSVDDLPLFGRAARIAIPARPLLDPREEILFDFNAGRAAIRWSWLAFFSLGRGRESHGRLTVTNKRLIYQTYRDPRAFFLFRHPERVGSFETPLEDVMMLKYRSWWRRVTYGISIMPGIAVVELTLANGDVVRFTDIQKSLFVRAMQDLADEHPALGLSES